MRLLGLDIGEKRIGIAISDPSGTVATPLDIVEARALDRDPAILRRIVDEYDVGTLVVGLPLTLSGDEGPQAVRVRSIADGLALAVGRPAILWDERLSSRAAERAMAEGGRDSRQRRGRIDMAAATLVLQAYLDSHRGSAPGATRSHD